ncbi:hypothetical protein CPC08DRAFT_710477 [Agrocybe pediades]|nr:hypothetical protein CPC08DRAFT_710477 [Agrocybe pediades]
MSTSYWIARREHNPSGARSYCRRPRLDSTHLPTTLANRDKSCWPHSISEIPRAINNIPPAPSPLYPDTRAPIPELDEKREAALAAEREQWEQGKAHLEKVSRQAMDTVIELSEAVLDTVVSAAECWKTKLAEHRAKREGERASSVHNTTNRQQ